MTATVPAPPAPPPPVTTRRNTLGRLAATTRTGRSRVRTVRPRPTVIAPGSAARPGALARVRDGLATVTTLGWTAVALVLAGTWASAVLGWLELRALAITTLVALVVAVVLVLGQARYEITLGLASHRVVVGERAVGRVEVRSTASRPLLPARIELPVGEGQAAFRLPRMRPDDVHEELFVVPTHRRQLIVVGPVRSVRSDPLGLLRRQVRWTDPQELYVHPRTVALGGSAAGFLRDLEGRPTPQLSDSDVSFHALREYQPGDDRRSVHWKTTARTGKIMVRQYEETRRSHTAVALSTAAGDYADPEELELVVSCAGSLGLQTLLEERELTVLEHDGPLRTSTPLRLLDDLAVVEATERRAGVADLARTTGSAVPGASVVVLLCGSTTTPTVLRAAQQHLPRGARAVAVRCIPGVAVRRSSIGDLTVLTVGSLQDLPRALRRVTG